jgi:O-antigen ligase
MRRPGVGTLQAINDVTFSVMIFMVIFFNYDSGGIGNVLSNLSIILFIGTELLHVIQRRRIIMNAALWSLMVFFFVCLLSCLYSSAQADSVEKVKTVLILTLLSLCLYNYAYERHDLVVPIVILLICVCLSVGYLLYNSSASLILGRRADVLLGNANMIATYYAYCAILSLYLLKRHILNRFFLLAAILILIAGIVISASRMAVVILTVGMLIVQYGMDGAQGKNIARQMRSTLMLTAVMGGIFYVVMNNETLYGVFGKRIVSLLDILTTGSSSIRETSTSDHLYLASLAFDRFLSSPVFGYGIGSFNQYLYHLSGRAIFSHNTLLELLSSVGLLGAVPYYSIHIGILAQSRRTLRRRGGVAAILPATLVLMMLLSHMTMVLYYQKAEYLFLFLFSVISDKASQGASGI